MFKKYAKQLLHRSLIGLMAFLIYPFTGESTLGAQCVAGYTFDDNTRLCIEYPIDFDTELGCSQTAIDEKKDWIGTSATEVQAFFNNWNSGIGSGCQAWCKLKGPKPGGNCEIQHEFSVM